MTRASPGGVVAVVVADLPEPDVWAPMFGVPLVARTVDGLLASGAVGRVVLLVRPGDTDRARPIRTGRPVVVHSGPRREVAGLVDGVRCVLLHDAARPLTPPALVADVVGAAVGHAVVLPVLPLPDTVKRVDGRDLVVGSPDRAGLRVVQTPQAVRPDLVDTLLACDAPLEQAWTRAGERAVTVPGDALAFPVRSSWDRELAELMVAQG